MEFNLFHNLSSEKQVKTVLFLILFFKKEIIKQQIRNKIIQARMRRKNSIKFTSKDSSDSINTPHSNGSHLKGQRFLKSEITNERQLDSDFLADLQNLDIEPIQNTNGDKFYIEVVQENDVSRSSQQKYQSDSQSIQFAQSTVWPDVFYGKKNMMSLLQQRNDICEMYKLNSKSLKQSLSNIRVYNDAQIIQFVKQLFSESPSYGGYDSMCFTIIPQMGLNTEKYFVFMSSDLKFVPQCKVCNFTTFLILNVQKKPKNQTLGFFSNSPFMKGKIICSNKNCKKSVLGEFSLSNNDQPQKSFTKTSSNFRLSSNQNSMKKEILTDRKVQTPMKKKPQLSQKQKMLIKKAAFKINA